MLRYVMDKIYEYRTKGNYQVFNAPKTVSELSEQDQAIVDKFHDLYYTRWQQGQGTIDISWMGYRTLKCPLDLWTYQEIIFDTKPDYVIETGTFLGGSAFFMAHVLEQVGQGQVVSVDLLQRENLPQHSRIQYLTGSSTSSAVIEKLKQLTAGKKCMVILDSDHSKRHVLHELKLYHSLVSPGCYLIVEDSNVNGHPTNKAHGPGPMEALEEFLGFNQDFVIDKARERFLMTLNPNGFLKRKPASSLQ